MPTNKSIPFVKMQALGNDLIIINALDPGERSLCYPGRDTPSAPDEPWPHLARQMTPRHFGVGADGLIVLLPSRVAEFRMRMFNPDGSEDMCGNGLRCLVKYLHDRGLATREEVHIETVSGVRNTRLLTHVGSQSVIQAEMGSPSLSPRDLPMKADLESALRYALELDGEIWEVNCISIGTPHAVIFVPERVSQAVFDRVSPKIEVHPLFPQRISVDWCYPEDRNVLRLRVWERAVGETLACGTAACAAAVAAHLLGHSVEEVEVHLPGGSLKVLWRPGEQILLTGPAEEVFRGWWPLRLR